MDTIKLKMHQKFVTKYFQTFDPRGLIIFHSLGSGKTLTSINIAKQYSKKQLFIICPLSLKPTFESEIRRSYPNAKYEISSYESTLKIFNDNIFYLENKVVIVDEAHRLRNVSGRHTSIILKALESAYKLIFLTGTLMVNRPSDISPLVNLLKKKPVLPYNNELFFFTYIKENYDYEKGKIDFDFINQDMFLDKIKKIISYYHNDADKESLSYYPSSKKHYIKVEMSEVQLTDYMKYLKKLSPAEYQFLVSGFDAFLKSKDGSMKSNIFLCQTRQISNTIDGNPHTQKYLNITKHIIEGPKPVVVYSNFKKNGIYPLIYHLKKNGIKHSIFTGSTTIKERVDIVKKYNEKKIPVLLITSAGGEGLDLKNTRQIHIMEPHWNESKIDQVIGRTIRYKSHVNLPPKEQFVDIYHWLSVFSKKDEDKNTLVYSADEILVNITRKKKKLINKFIEMIKDKGSIEKEFEKIKDKKL